MLPKCVSICSRLWTCGIFVAALAVAETRVYDFEIGWANRNPDGRHERRVIAINDQWPLPTIEATVGDRIVVNAHNHLGDKSTSLHFHGLFQNGTNHMDGSIGVTQCPIPPGASMTYDFVVDQPGTYWYHSHETAQYPDGLRGPMIVHDPDHPYAELYDEELVLTLSDWYHEEMSQIMKDFLTVTNPTGAEPVPQSALQNDTHDLQVPVTPGKRYFLRIINLSAFASHYFWIEGHDFEIIELDGVYHEPTKAEMLYVTAAQRVGVIFTAKNETSRNYAMVAAMDQEMFDVIPDDLIPNAVSHLVYDASKPLPVPEPVDEFEPIDDFNLIPTDREEIFKNPARTITLNVSMENLGDGANYAFFNNITYKTPVVPTLFTALSASGDDAMDPLIYGDYTNSFVLDQGEVIELVLNNKDDGKHPFHMHGHNFQVIVRSEENAGAWDPAEADDFPEIPMKRDTVMLQPQGNLVLRFRSDNPGIWQFHCHVEWHMKQGLLLTLVEAPLALQKTLNIPADHLAVCKAAKMPTEGNAAGNTVDWLDLTGQPSPPKPLPDGFTPRGIVALVFSIISGLIGTVVIFWYAYGDIPDESEEEQALGGDDRSGYEGLSNGNGHSFEEDEGPNGSRVPDETARLLN
ncbi:hypothetical protein BP6252_08971 [Coleophoma cylindrospora]|uniref:Iron transport multicopper oxidase FET3 n=1 Tax=Coleophoma cylindrospora TaxID=1849047 RepID=A0A3D8R0N3_9HELO|nr:hypothetical protein BP6252_08971 [Coleophoma cylindrospora]